MAKNNSASPSELNLAPTHGHSRRQSVQDVFLENIQKARASVTIFLVNGVKLQGIVPWFDAEVVILRRDGHTQLVYKHAISTIMPISPITLFDKADDAETHDVE